MDQLEGYNKPITKTINSNVTLEIYTNNDISKDTILIINNSLNDSTVGLYLNTLDKIYEHSKYYNELNLINSIPPKTKQKGSNKINKKRS